MAAAQRPSPETMNQNQTHVMGMLNQPVSGLSIVSGNGPSTLTNTTGGTGSITFSTTPATVGTSLWNYWQNDYYPFVIKESYPVYIQERAMDKGKHAFELLKALMDKKLLKIEKVSDFIEAMDTILKTL